MTKHTDPLAQLRPGKSGKRPTFDTCKLISIDRVERSRLFPAGAGGQADTMTDYYEVSVLALDGRICLGARERQGTAVIPHGERRLAERVVVGEHGLWITTGAEMVVRLLVEVHDVQPPVGNLDRWEAVIEFDLDLPQGLLDVSNSTTKLNDTIEANPGLQRGRIYCRIESTEQPCVRVVLWKAHSDRSGTTVLKPCKVAGAVPDQDDDAIEAFVVDLFKDGERERERLRRRIHELRAAGRASTKLLTALTARLGRFATEIRELATEVDIARAVGDAAQAGRLSGAVPSQRETAPGPSGRRPD